MTDEASINWGYNCLTAGVHHGRPEEIWNIPLLYAAGIYKRQTLKSLVIARIYNDALQIVDHNDRFDNEWASRVREIAEEKYDTQLQHKIGELSRYYKSRSWEIEQEDIARRVIDDKLNPHYQPLHDHDTINMLCRILGTTASMKATSGSKWEGDLR